MMSDSKVAKLLLSAIIGEKIVELDFTSTEYILKTGIKKKQLNRTLEQITVCRLDFAAKIKTETNEYKIVTIALQKAKFVTDVMRFRRYLGQMYQSAENSTDINRTKARQIYCIYFLNYEIGLGDEPIIKVDYTANADGKTYKGKNEFIDSLHHKSWIVQVRQLKGRRKTEAENLLSIFDQSNSTSDQHILNIEENQFPEEYRHIIRKLREAYEDQKVRNEMQMEDDYINELLMKDEEIAKKDEIIAKKDELIAKLLAERENK
jgi:hypothetical protein